MGVYANFSNGVGHENEMQIFYVKPKVCMKINISSIVSS